VPDSRLFIGLMSGTSLDGVDCALVEFSAGPVRVLGSSSAAFDPPLREELLRLCERGENEIARYSLAGVRLADVYARAVAATLKQAGITAARVAAIGCHGQTVRHSPREGYSVQIGNPARLAEQTGIAVAADFRSRDIAAGGQGAPLVPAFHASVFASDAEDRVVVNIGGIANVTLLPASGAVGGFDTGPGNCLMDAWIGRHSGHPYDAQGAWARSGQVDANLLARLLDDPYFQAAPPKSTGREHFNLRWLEQQLRGSERTQDVQATLLECTAQSIQSAIGRGLATAKRVVVCGGGAKNAVLLERLATLLAPRVVETSDAWGLAPQLVEATAFAWLARCALDRKPGNITAVTGARGPRVLGAIYPA
jgi:anhydro-N-acetylmuramic acid kinase